VPTHFFADAAFLALLRFWDDRRGGRALPEWNGDAETLPPELRPLLVVADGLPDPRYAYVGAAFVSRWGDGAIGRRVADVLPAAYHRYIQSLFDDAAARRAPVFSAAVFQQGTEDDVVMTGRLFTPFTRPGGDVPAAIMNLQFFRGSQRPLSTVTAVQEIRRDLIAIAPTLCSQLEEARRYYQAARSLGRSLSEEIENIASRLSGSALISLTPFADPLGN
jgi:hypothetical protein